MDKLILTRYWTERTSHLHNISDNLPCGVFGFREDFQQLLIGEKKESRKIKTLFLQVVIKTFEDNFQKTIGLL